MLLQHRRLHVWLTFAVVMGAAYLGWGVAMSTNRMAAIAARLTSDVTVQSPRQVLSQGAKDLCRRGHSYLKSIH
jgi:hypothetical protein